MTEQELLVPEKYRKLGATEGFNPDPAENLRIIVEGLPGTGKSTFIGARPRTAIIDCDKAQQNVIYKGDGTAYFHINSFDQYARIRDMLVSDAGKGQAPFQCVAIDTLDAFIKLLDEHLVKERNLNVDSMKQWGHKGAGYRVIGDRLIKELDILDRAGYPYMLACHLLEKEQEYGEVTITVRKAVMPQTFMKDLVGMTDMKVRMYRSMSKEPVVEEETKKLPNGKTVTRKKKIRDRVVSEYWVGMLPQDPADKFDDTKRRVATFQDPVRLSLENPWSDFEHVYSQACKDAKELV